MTHIDARTVVVPRQPAPVQPLGRQERRSDIDEILDEVLPVHGGGPGLFDVALVIAGAALVTWSVLGSGPSGATGLGLVIAALGLVLPVRTVAHAARERWQAHRTQRLLAHGRALVVADATVHRLLELHGELATRAGDDRGARAFAAAHAALLDVAGILDGRPMPGPADRARILSLTDAVTELCDAYRQGADRSRSLEAARADLDAIDRHDTLHRIQETIADL